MIDEYVKQINGILDKIKEEGNDLVNQCIEYSTSGELCVGGTLYHYGKLFKIIFESKDNDSTIQKIQLMKEDSDYDGIFDLLCECQENLISGLKIKKNFDDVKMYWMTKLEHEYILDTILKCC